MTKRMLILVEDREGLELVKNFLSEKEATSIFSNSTFSLKNDEIYILTVIKGDYDTSNNFDKVVDLTHQSMLNKIIHNQTEKTLQIEYNNLLYNNQINVEDLIKTKESEEQSIYITNKYKKAINELNSAMKNLKEVMEENDKNDH